MTQTPMQKAVEAMHIAFNSRRGAFPDEDWNVALTAALASLEADGWKLMPREPTDAMMVYGDIRWVDDYTAMFNAAPEVD